MENFILLKNCLEHNNYQFSTEFLKTILISDISTQNKFYWEIITHLDSLKLIKLSQGEYDKLLINAAVNQQWPLVKNLCFKHNSYVPSSLGLTKVLNVFIGLRDQSRLEYTLNNRKEILELADYDKLFKTAILVNDFKCFKTLFENKPIPYPSSNLENILIEAIKYVKLDIVKFLCSTNSDSQLNPIIFKKVLSYAIQNVLKFTYSDNLTLIKILLNCTTLIEPATIKEFFILAINHKNAALVSLFLEINPIGLPNSTEMAVIFKQLVDSIGINTHAKNESFKVIYSLLSHNSLINLSIEDITKAFCTLMQGISLDWTIYFNEQHLDAKIVNDFLIELLDDPSANNFYILEQFIQCEKTQKLITDNSINILIKKAYDLNNFPVLALLKDKYPTIMTKFNAASENYPIKKTAHLESSNQQKKKNSPHLNAVHANKLGNADAKNLSLNRNNVETDELNSLNNLNYKEVIDLLNNSIANNDLAQIRAIFKLSGDKKPQFNDICHLTEKTKNTEIIKILFFAFHIVRLDKDIEDLNSYGQNLSAVNDSKAFGDKAIQLANNLKMLTHNLAQAFYSNADTQVIKKEFVVALKQGFDEMKEHRAWWKLRLINILMAISGIGLVINYAVNKQFFFSNTKRQNLVCDITKDLEKLNNSLTSFK